MYAIIESGGKQFKVAPGDVISVEKLMAEDGNSYLFENVLAIVSDGKADFGDPYIKGAAVNATVIGSGKGKKVIVYKLSLTHPMNFPFAWPFTVS